MRRRVARPTLALLLILTLLPCLAGPGPLAQGTPAAPPSPPPVSPSGTTERGPAYVLSLQDSMKAAMENNLDLVVRAYDPLRGETQVILAESAFDPAITGTATSASTQRPSLTSFIRSSKTHELNIAFDDPTIFGGRYRLEADAFDITLTPPTKEWDLSWKASVVQPLLRGFGPRVNKTFIVEARNLLGIDESRFRQTVIDTLSATEKAYWDLNFTLLNLQTNRAALQLALDFLEQNRIKVRVGTLAPIEITQAEAQVADREETVIIAENLVQTAEDALRRVMNVPKDSEVWSEPIEPSDSLPLIEATPVMAEAVSTALQHRPDMEQARLDVRIKETDLAWRRNMRRWNLNLSGEYGKLGIAADMPVFTCTVVEPDTGVCLDGSPTGQILSHGSYGDSYEALRGGANLDWRVSLLLGIPLGNRQAIANYTDAEYALEQSRRTLDTVELGARVQVRDAVRSVETTLKRVRAAQVNVRLQKEKMSAEQKKFENGMSTSFQVLQFQTDLFVAESRQNLALADYNKALVELERVQGTLLEARRVEMPSIDGRRTMPYRPRARVPDAPGGDRRPAGAESSDEDAALSLDFRLPDQFVFDGGRLVARRLGSVVAWGEGAPGRSGPAGP